MSSLTVALNDGTFMPWLAFGTGTALYGHDAKKAMLAAIAAGITHLDGAQMYNNEDSFGDAIVESGVPRSSLYVTTKLHKLPSGTTVRESLQESLRKLKMDYVDLFLIHMPVHHSDLKSIWNQFEEVQKEGFTKSIGVSNFQVKDLELIAEGATVVPAVNQIEYHPYVFKASQPVMEYMKHHDIIATSYSGLTPITHPQEGPLSGILSIIARRLEKTRGKPVTEGQVLQVWLRQKGIPAITTSKKEERLRAYLDVLNMPDLTPEEVRAIEDTGSQVHHRSRMPFMDAAH